MPRLMSVEQELGRTILRAIAQPVSEVEGVFQVDAEPRTEWNGKSFIDIELDNGDTLRLTMEVIDEE